MLSLDLLDKVAKRLDFHSTAIIFLDFFDKDQTSLNITRLHSTHSTRWPNGSIFSSIFCRVKNRVKNRVVWPGPKGASLQEVPSKLHTEDSILVQERLQSFLILACEKDLTDLDLEDVTMNSGDLKGAQGDHGSRPNAFGS